MLHGVPEGSNFPSDLVSVWVGFWASLLRTGLFLACLALFDPRVFPRDKRGKPVLEIEGLDSRSGRKMGDFDPLRVCPSVFLF